MQTALAHPVLVHSKLTKGIRVLYAVDALKAAWRAPDRGVVHVKVEVHGKRAVGSALSIRRSQRFGTMNSKEI